LGLYIGLGKISQVGAFDKAQPMAAYLCYRFVTAIAQLSTNSSHCCNHKILPAKMRWSGGAALLPRPNCITWSYGCFWWVHVSVKFIF